jgi:hypothetical protein
MRRRRSPFREHRRIPSSFSPPYPSFTLTPSRLVILSPFFLLCSLTGVRYFRHRPHSRVTVLPRPALPISIIVPVFNRERYLERAVYSATNQSLKSIEIVIVDDCSTDSSFDIIQRLQAEDSRIKIIHHSTNAGTHVARISAVRFARGDFILSLDPDDALQKYIAEDALHAALVHGSDFVEFQVLEVFEPLVRVFSFLSPPVIEANGSTIANFFGERELNWNIWKRLVKRELYLRAIEALPNATKVKRVMYAEDKLHVGMILLFVHKFYFLKEIGYIYYRSNPGNSESGALQTKEDALDQRSYVERGLQYLWWQIAQRKYRKWMETPLGIAPR